MARGQHVLWCLLAVLLLSNLVTVDPEEVVGEGSGSEETNMEDPTTTIAAEIYEVTAAEATSPTTAETLDATTVPPPAPVTADVPEATTAGPVNGALTTTSTESDAKPTEAAMWNMYYLYGPSQGDLYLGHNIGYSCDWSGKFCASDFIQIPKVQIFSCVFKRIKIYTNGYVTFGLNFERRFPDTLNKNLLSYTKLQTANKQGCAMLAPLWTDNDARSGAVYYHIYDLTQPGSTAADQARVKHAVDQARRDVIAHGGVSVTDVTWVMVITWSEMLPRMYYSSAYDSPNTFQLIIAYDPSRYQTFAMFVYVDLGWNNDFMVRRSMIGYLSFKEDETLQLAPSMKSTAFRLHRQIGNTGERGRYMFRVASGRHDINYDQKCYNWFANEMRRWRLVRYYWSWTLVCPCDFRLAMMDGRWTFDWRQYYETGFERRCIYERMPWTQSTQECCYTWSGSLISTEDGRGGQTFFYHPRYVRQHDKYDILPKQWCCQFTDNCQYFYHVRPMDHCWGYTPLYIGWFYGDPHIRTLDGFQYTFNGLGEYTLIETTHGNFTLQGRTAKARDANGTETDATVFSAFAAKDVDSDTVHVEMSGTRDGLVVFVENTNVTDWFDGANVTDEKVVGNVALTKKNVTQIEASFKSGFSLTIGVSAEQLDITVGASDKFKGSTKGLMGVFNDDPSDDLLPPGENAVPLSNSSSEKTIFTEFGELWRIHSIDSLFYYAPDESYSTFAHTEFQPVFLTDAINAMSPAQKAKANQTCGVNKECLFDFAVTGNEDAAAAALATNNNNQATASSLANGSPNITVDSVFNATVGQNNTLIVTTSDPDGDTVNVTLDSMLPQDATWEANVYTWTPGNMNPLNISFSASDGNGGVAAAVVSVNLCNCSGHGECLFGLLADGYELKQTFRIVQCNCSTGWEGVYCELDLDGCKDNPCTEGTNCTDLTPAEQVTSGKSYNCSDCPEGTEDNEGTCLPINECDHENPRHDCEQICVDTAANYTCTCRDGYRLMDNGRNCTDINECDERTSGCEQECKNTDGSFVCSCFNDYTCNTDNMTCTMSQTLIDKCNHMNCSYGCKNQSNNYVCLCQTGYTLNNDSTTCDDIDECRVENGGCVHNCTNFEGGFNCSCNDGFQLMNDKKGCKPCPSGTWGKDCLLDCNCLNSYTVCDVTTGCAECPVGFTGGDCRIDIDECANSTCDEHATCNNTIGTFKCVCGAGYTQYNATTCQDFDECESDPCLNGAECNNEDKEYTCTCVPGYTGRNCETDINDCDCSPCQHNGTCTDMTNRYRCTCVRGFTGRNCETEIAICDSNPCKNNGSCSQDNGNYRCDCVAGYTGQSCETDFDECTSKPCQNGANCSTPDFNGFSCQCLPGFTGDRCETNIDECENGPCVNKGTCEDQVNGFVCNCISGYTGSTCETDFDECTSNPCQNGANCSTSDFNSFSCNCLPEFTGERCEAKLKTTKYYGRFRVPELTYTESLADETSNDYKALAANVTHVITQIYRDCEEVGPKLVDVSDITFTNGSVMVDFVLLVDATITDKDILIEIIANQTDFNIGCFNVDRDSIRLSDKKMGGTEFAICDSNPCKNNGNCSQNNGNYHCDCEAGYTGHNCETDVSSALSPFPWVAVVLGTILSVVLLVLVVILVCFTVRKFRHAKSRDRRSDADDISIHYSPTAMKRQMLWQERKPTMPPVDAAVLQQTRYDRQRMNVISRAMDKVANVDWSIMRNFANRNPGQQDDMLHRNAPAQRRNDVWSWK